MFTYVMHNSVAIFSNTTSVGKSPSSIKCVGASDLIRDCGSNLYVGMRVVEMF